MEDPMADDLGMEKYEGSVVSERAATLRSFPRVCTGEVVMLAL